MGIISLKNRITTDSHEYYINKKSQNSLVYVSNNYILDTGSPDVLILRVGETYRKKSQKIEIPAKGVVVPPGKSVVIETKETIATPLNVIGLISGVGCNIFQGGFVSSGKIDQNFEDKLKIGFYNAGQKNIVFKQGDVLASVVFISTDETLASPSIDSGYDNEPAYKMTKWDHIKNFWSQNWLSILSVLIAIVALTNDIITKS